MNVMIHTVENEHLKLSVRSSGGEIISLKDKWNDLEYIWQGDPEYWVRRAPVLFPIVGKLKDHKYKVEGQEYVLPQHGFARNLHFELVEEKPLSQKWKLQSGEETEKVYPYKFELFINYILQERTVTTVYEVKNTDKKDIFFSLGAHPGFNVPAFDYEQFEDYYIEFEKPETAKRHLLKDGLFTGETADLLNNSKTLDLNYQLFEKDAIVLKDLSSKRATLKSKKSGFKLDLVFDGFPYFGIWTPKAGAPFLCLEPWHGLADYKNTSGDFKEKEGVIRLPQGETFTSRYSFHVTT